MSNSNESFNILVTGSNGQVGSELQTISKDYDYNFFFTTRETLDISNKDDIKNFCESNNINTIINCAGYTAVDKAQTDGENANKINTFLIISLVLNRYQM